MADDIKKVEVAITSAYDGRGATQAAADQEKLTNTGKGLATTLPQMEEATKAYTIRTEEEYLAVQKAHDALAAKIPILQAAGKDTKSYEAALANLSDALSSEKALTIAQTIEQNALNKAKLAAFEAAEADKKAQLEEADATQVNTVALREQLVVLRELMSGRFNRLPGSISILAGASGAGPRLTEGIMAATMAFVGLDMALSAIEKHDAPLEKILGEDLGEGIDKAQALADAWTGIADAVAEANQQLSSATAFYDQDMEDVRSQLAFTLQLIEAQKQLALQRLQNQKDSGQIGEGEYERRRAAIEGQSRADQFGARKKEEQEELGNKANEVANAKIQSEAAAKRAAAFKLPESDKEAQANADAMKARADEFRKQAEQSKADAQYYNDASISARTPAGFLSSMFSTTTFWKGAWKQFQNGGPATFNPFGEFSKQAAQDAKEQTEAANSADREAERINEQIKARQMARSEAKKAAADAATAEQEFQRESNPNKAGSVAAKIRNDTQLENIARVNAGESELTTDIRQIQKDLSVHGPKAQDAMRDAAAALKDAVSTLATLAALGDDVKEFRAQIEVLRRQLDGVSNTAHQSLNTFGIAG